MLLSHRALGELC